MELHRPSGRVWLGLGLAATTMVLWGVLPLALQLALRSLDAVTITAFRFVVAAALLFVWLRRRRQLPPLRTLGRTEWWLLLAAIVGLTVNYVSYLMGLDQTSAANASVLIQAAPLLLSLGGIFVFREHFTRLQWLGFVVLVGGLVTFFWGQLGLLAAEAARYLGGVGLLMFAAVTWAAYGLAQKQLLHTLPSQAVMLCLYAGCGLLLVPASEPGALLSLSPLAWGALVFCALNTLVAYGTFGASLEHLAASRVSAVLALTPLATLLAATSASILFPAWFDAEALDARSVLGALMVVGGSLATSLGGRPDRT